jgi:4-hydroxybenzoyl-CoA thioesterase
MVDGFHGCPLLAAARGSRKGKILPPVGQLPLKSCVALLPAAMPRIKIDLPACFAFATEVPIYINHINHTNHLDNTALLALVAEARTRFFKALGYSELNIEGVGIIIADVATQYRAEAFHGEIMVVEMAAGDFNKYGCDLVWRLTNKASGSEVARGKHGIVFFDYAVRQPARIPAAFLTKVGD